MLIILLFWGGGFQGAESGSEGGGAKEVSLRISANSYPSIRASNESRGAGIFTAAKLIVSGDRLARVFSWISCRALKRVTGRSGLRVSKGSQSVGNRDLAVAKPDLSVARYNLRVANRDLAISKCGLSVSN